MTPEEFINKWKDSKLSEKAGAQPYFLDLCELLGVEKPHDPDNYCFERGAKKAGGGDGWADVWKRGFFGWENKRPGQLKTALKQLTDYAPDLENPNLLVVSDRLRIEIHTNFPDYPDETRTILLEDIGKKENLDILKWVFTDPIRLRPLKSRKAITEEAAGQFADIAKAMRDRDIKAGCVAHFLIQCLFCMFAEDEGLLPNNVFTNLLKNAGKNTELAAKKLTHLFTAMRKGGDYGDYDIDHFNGGLFKIIDVPPLEKSDLAALATASERDWRAIEPAIFGTLFERGLNPSKRSQLGAHYTDVETIKLLIDPVITRPLTAEWEAAKLDIAADKTKTRKHAKNRFHGFLERLRNFRVLDPACGSGNFLYLALTALKDLEKRVNLDAEKLGLQRQVSIEVSPANVLGLELEPYAAELARVTVWIGELQWMLRNNYDLSKNPILKPLNTIENRDALMNEDGSEAEWPKADVIVGNPPFLGDKKMLGELGEEYVTRLRKLYKGRVPGGADLVTYWFEKARAQIEAGNANRAGLVATNSIRGGANRKVLERVCEGGRIFEAWSDEEWVNDGAAVRVSLIAFSKKIETFSTLLNGKVIGEIYPDLSASQSDSINSALNLTKATRVLENIGVCFMGVTKVGSFDIPGQLARDWLSLPNPHGKPNSEVLRPSWNGLDITRRMRDIWIIDYGTTMTESDAAYYESPFEHIAATVKKERSTNNREQYRRLWWRHGEPRPALRKLLESSLRYIATPEVAKHRIFAFVPVSVLPDKNLQVITRSDNTTFGILQSRFHELWALRMGTSLEDRPRYTPTTTFETFPFPENTLTNPDPDTNFPAIAEAAKTLNERREDWLNPLKWVDWVQTEEEAEAGFPKRPVAKPGFEAELKKRTLTNLYNEKPSWLINAHQALDKAVAAAYGWDNYTPEWTDEDILQRLLALNLERAKNQTAPVGEPSETIEDEGEDTESTPPNKPTAKQNPRAKRKAVD